MAARLSIVVRPEVQSLPPDPYTGDPWSWAFVLFRPLADLPGYGVDTLGGLWGCLKPGPAGGIYDHWRPARVGSNEKGYLNRTFVGPDGRRYTKYLHILVLETFAGPCPPGMECRHKNGVRSDCRLSNLRWGTPAENAADKVGHGTDPIGSRNGCAKLTEDDVPDILALSAAGMSRKAVAARFGVTAMAIQRIVKGDGWRHAR